MAQHQHQEEQEFPIIEDLLRMELGKANGRYALEGVTPEDRLNSLAFWLDAAENDERTPIHKLSESWSFTGTEPRSVFADVYNALTVALNASSPDSMVRRPTQKLVKMLQKHVPMDATSHPRVVAPRNQKEFASLMASIAIGFNSAGVNYQRMSRDALPGPDKGYLAKMANLMFDAKREAESISDMASPRMHEQDERGAEATNIGTILSVFAKGVKETLMATSIAESSGVSKNVVRRELAVMEQAGLVVRTAPGADRWKITSAGRAAIQEGNVNPTLERVNRAMFQGNDPGELKESIDAALRAGNSRDDVIGAVGGADRWNATVQIFREMDMLGEAKGKGVTFVRTDQKTGRYRDHIYVVDVGGRGVTVHVGTNEGKMMTPSVEKAPGLTAKEYRSAMSRASKYHKKMNEDEERAGGDPLMELTEGKKSYKKALDVIWKLEVGKDDLKTIKKATDAAAAAGATKAEIMDAIGGTKDWNTFVRALKKAGLVESDESYGEELTEGKKSYKKALDVIWKLDVSKDDLKTIKKATDAAAAAGATKAEIMDAIGGTKDWNMFVRALKQHGLVK